MVDSESEDEATARENALLSLQALDKEGDAPPEKGLFAMKFMQRGLEKGKVQAQADLQNAIREFEGGVSEDEGEAEESAEEESTLVAGRGSFAKSKSKPV